MNTTRVLVVDDSPTMRAILRTHLERDPQITVVGEAGDPYEAREAIKALSPDVVTLDINMPRMDGLAFLEKIMRLRPTPVIMVSSEVCEGAAASIEALAIGAFDCVAKPAHGGPSDPFADLPAKVKAAARAPRDTLGAGKRHNPAAPDFRANGRVIAIGPRPEASMPCSRCSRPSPPTAPPRSSPSICRRASPRASPKGSTRIAHRGSARRVTARR